MSDESRSIAADRREYVDDLEGVRIIVRIDAMTIGEALSGSDFAISYAVRVIDAVRRVHGEAKKSADAEVHGDHGYCEPIWAVPLPQRLCLGESAENDGGRSVEFALHRDHRLVGRRTGPDFKLSHHRFSFD